MKKAYIYIICLIAITIAIIMGRYYAYKQKIAEINQYNLQYEQYSQREIYGTELATLINKAMDSNDKNEVSKDILQKDDKQIYIYVPNDTNSINIEIKMIDKDNTYKMEAFYQAKLEDFVQLYNECKFSCQKKEYHKDGKIKYMLFEQVSK